MLLVVPLGQDHSECLSLPSIRSFMFWLGKKEEEPTFLQPQMAFKSSLSERSTTASASCPAVRSSRSTVSLPSSAV